MVRAMPIISNIVIVLAKAVDFRSEITSLLYGGIPNLIAKGDVMYTKR